MSLSKSDAVTRARRYAKLKRLTIEKEFGDGFDGYVLSTSCGTAVKVFKFAQLFRQELEVYQYLKKWRITYVEGLLGRKFQIPRLISYDSKLSVIEMTVVSPPFVLDFVGARIEIPFEYDDEWIAKKSDEFEGDWAEVKKVIWGLEQHGIYLSDVHPRNIMCR